jgi:hypothetical protein
MFGWLLGLRAATKEPKVWAEIGSGRDKRWAKQILSQRRSDFPRGTRCRIRQHRGHFPIECHIPKSLADRMIRTGHVIDYR